MTERKSVVLTHCWPAEKNLLAGKFVQDWVCRTLKGDICLMHIPFGGNMLYTRRWIKLAQYMWNAARRVAGIRAGSIVYAHWWIPLGWLAARTDATVFVFCHGGDVAWLEKHRLFARCLRPAARKVVQWSFVSNSLRGRFLKLYPMVDVNKTVVCPMQADGRVFFDFVLTRIPRSYIVCSALVPRKNVDIAIWYCANIDRKGEGKTMLFVVGDGMLRKDLERLASNLNVQAKFLGQLSQYDLAWQFNLCETFLSFSEDEGYGLSIDEAKLCGCKTVVSAGDGKQEHADVVLPMPNKRKLLKILGGYRDWTTLSDEPIGCDYEERA